MQLTREQLAKKIADNLSCTAKVWAKGGKVRVYLSNKGKEYGYVSIGSDVDWNLTGYGNNTYGEAIREAIAGVEICEPAEVVPGVRRLTRGEADELADRSRARREESPRQVEQALDAMYGKGGWDDRDRLDYEG